MHVEGVWWTATSNPALVNCRALRKSGRPRPQSTTAGRKSAYVRLLCPSPTAERCHLTWSWPHDKETEPNFMQVENVWEQIGGLSSTQFNRKLWFLHFSVIFPYIGLFPVNSGPRGKNPLPVELPSSQLWKCGYRSGFPLHPNVAHPPRSPLLRSSEAAPCSNNCAFTFVFIIVFMLDSCILLSIGYHLFLLFHRGSK